MAALSGLIALAVDAGAPNNAGSDGETTTRVKSTWVHGRQYPYVSAQAFRRWLRDTMAAQGMDPSPTHREGREDGGGNQKAYTDADPVRYADDDVFGYLRAGKGKTNLIRETVLFTGTFLATHPVRPTEDFGVMSRGIDFPVLYQHEFYTADLAAPFVFDTGAVGRFTFGTDGGRPNYLTKDTALAVAEQVGAGASLTTVRGQPALELPVEERRSRVAALLDALALVSGGAKRAAHYGDRTPALVLLAPVTAPVNPFYGVLGADDSGRATRVDADVLVQEWDAFADVVDGPVYLGWRPGWLREQRHAVERALQGRIAAGHLVWGHPREVLTTLAEELRAGDHDAWLQE